MTAIRVIIVDDHDLFRRGLADVLEEEDDIQVVGQARNGKEAIKLVEAESPDVVFMDLNLPEQSGIEITAYITQKWPQVRVLVLTVSEQPADLLDALRVGAIGYVLKTASPSDIIDALRQVSQGWVVISPSMAPRFLADFAHSGPQPSAVKSVKISDASYEQQLTLREQEILRHVAKGMSNADIAQALVVSENTVKTHIKNILGKLQMRNRSEAAAYAARMGYLDSKR